MKREFNSDINQENLDIARQILNDSENIKTDHIFKDDLLENIDAESIVSPKKHTRKKIYAIASAAACIMVAIGVAAWWNTGQKGLSSGTGIVVYPETDATQSTMSDKETESSIAIASDYTEIYNRMKSVINTKVKKSMAYNESAIEDSAKSSSSNASSGTTGTNSPDYAGQKDSSVNYSDTNEQTENVHEGDIVKTDGKYIYTLNYNEDKDVYYITITSADGMKLKTLSKINFTAPSSYDQTFEELYVMGDKLIVLGSLDSDFYEDDSENNYGILKNNTKLDIGTSYPDSEKTIIYIYDISDRGNPKQISRNTQEGSLESSRLSDEYLYTISVHYMDEITEKHCVPEVNGKLIQPDCIYLPVHIGGQQYTVITALDVNSSDDFCDTVAVAGNTTTVYASEDNLYLISESHDGKDISKSNIGKKALKKSNIPVYNHAKLSNGYVKNWLKFYSLDISAKDVVAYRDTAVYEYKDSSQIVKYQYNKSKLKFVASTIVDGCAKDNLSFDEKDGYLRFVTTESSYIQIETRINYYDKSGKLLFYTPDDTDWVQRQEETNNLFVLNKNFSSTTEIADLANGEEIYSARFFGDYGYFVTYRNTDPLFSVDFSDMENPKIIGKLKLPGFSDYLHFYKDNLLFGFGVNTDETDGDWDCIKLEMYDITDGKASQESKLLLEEYEDSDALYDYKDFMIDSDKNYIGFTADKYYDYQSANFEDEERGSYYLLYTYKNKKFKNLLEVSLEGYYTARGLYIGDYLYIVMPDYGIKALNIKTYKNDKKVEFEEF